MTTRTQSDLEGMIVQARDNGDTATMHALQDEYRSSNFMVTRVSTRPDAITIRDRSSSQVARSTTTPAMRSRNAPPFVSPLPDTQTAVTFTKQAEGAIREIPFDGGVEIGAYMFGQLSSREIVVHQVVECSREASRDRVWLDYRTGLQWADHFQRAGWRMLGCLHSHPGAQTRDCSFEDAAAWTALAAHHRHAWVGAIAFEHHTWAHGATWGFRPELRAWIAQPGGVTVAPVANVVIERNAGYGG